MLAVAILLATLVMKELINIIIMIITTVFFILYIAKADVTPIRQGSTVLADKAGKLNTQQKYVVCSFAVLIVLL